MVQWAPKMGIKAQIWKKLKILDFFWRVSTVLIGIRVKFYWNSDGKIDRRATLDRPRRRLDYYWSTQWRVVGVIPVSRRQLTSHEVTCLNMIQITLMYVSGVQESCMLCVTPGLQGSLDIVNCVAWKDLDNRTCAEGCGRGKGHFKIAAWLFVLFLKANGIENQSSLSIWIKLWIAEIVRVLKLHSSGKSHACHCKMFLKNQKFAILCEWALHTRSLESWWNC